MVQRAPAGPCTAGTLVRRRPPSGCLKLNSKYSTVNYIPSTSQHQQSVGVGVSHHSVAYPTQQQHQHQHKSSGASSCLVGFMKFIQHQCHPRRKPDTADANVFMVHDDIVKAIRQLKCDLERMNQLQSCGKKIHAGSNASDTRRLLTNMASKVYEIEDKLVQPNMIACSEMMNHRRTTLNLIKTLQKTVGCYLECEADALRDRQAKLCNLLKCLQCVENEFRCMTRGIKQQCCDQSIGHAIKKKSNLTIPSNVTSKKSIITLNNSCNASKSLNSTKNYEVTGVDVVYTKSHVKTFEPTTGNACECAKNDESIEEECIEEQVACHLDADGSQPVCEVRIRNGKQIYQLCDSQPIKDTICGMSNVWYESAKQLINAFHSC